MLTVCRPSPSIHLSIDKCSIENGGCDSNAKCSYNFNGQDPTCECKSGYQGNGLSCASKFQIKSPFV